MSLRGPKKHILEKYHDTHTKGCMIYYAPYKTLTKNVNETSNKGCNNIHESK